MRKCAAWFCAFALLAVFSTRPAEAQIGPNFFAGGGLTQPFGDYGDYAELGFMGLAGLSFAPNEDSPVWFGAEGLYGRNSHEGDAGDATNLFGANGFIGLDIGDTERPHPYVYGTVGLLVHQYSPGDSGFDSESETKASFGGGAGVGFPAGLWVEAKVMATDETRFVAFLVGWTFSSN